MLERADPPNIVIDPGTPVGAIQVPSGMELIVTGFDSPTIGGCARMDVVISTDMARRPGSAGRGHAAAAQEVLLRNRAIIHHIARGLGMITAIDINCDMGESFGNYSFGSDREIMPYLSSVNVACGFHGGDPVHMERTVRLAKACGAAVGVHWGLPDLAGFGRRRMELSADEARCITLYQAGALLAFATANSVAVDHWVPHGALYPMLARDETLAAAMLDAIAATRIEPIIYWPTPLESHRFYDLARQRGFRVVPEIAADLRYRADGSLIIERQKQPQDLSELSDRLQRFLEYGRLATIDGDDLEFEAQAILIHSDGPNAADVARTVRSLVEHLGIAVRPASTLVHAR